MHIHTPDRTAADTAASVSRAVDPGQDLVFIRHIGDDDAYRRGDALLVVPGIWTAMPPQLLAVMRDRRACTLTGRCPRCDICVEPATGTFHHEPDCPVGDGHLRPALQAWVWQVGRYARGRRIQETPGDVDHPPHVTVKTRLPNTTWPDHEIWVVDCPYCGREHLHGDGPGHRVADCFNHPDSDPGYIVDAPPDWRPRCTACLRHEPHQP
ncbi:hypothetical protein [Micromonospora aurantiaca (nom. illeg.)]|uniref:hypothetical protein n=1 Tax=Micromonospora aurantiaca (nom. illeg.) TaxID=47850 RepID=UPI003F4A0DA3